MSILKSRRIGRFRITIDLLNEIPEAARVVTSQLSAVVRTTLRIETSDIEYVALCDDFPEISECDRIPLYSANLNKRDDGTLEFAGWQWGDRPLAR